MVVMDAMDVTVVTGAMDVMGVMAVMGVMVATQAGGAMAAAVMIAMVVADVCQYRPRELKVEVEKAVTVRQQTISRGSALLAYRAPALAESRGVR